MWWVDEMNHNMRTWVVSQKDDRIHRYASYEPAGKARGYGKPTTSILFFHRPSYKIRQSLTCNYSIYSTTLKILSRRSLSYAFSFSSSRNLEWNLCVCGWTGSCRPQYWYVPGSVDGLEATLHSNMKYDLVWPTSQLCSWGWSLHSLSWLEGVKAAPGFAHLCGSPFAILFRMSHDPISFDVSSEYETWSFRVSYRRVYNGVVTVGCYVEKSVF